MQAVLACRQCCYAWRAGLQAALAGEDDSAARRRENQAWRIWSLMLAKGAAPVESAADEDGAEEDDLAGMSAALPPPQAPAAGGTTSAGGGGGAQAAQPEVAAIPKTKSIPALGPAAKRAPAAHPLLSPSVAQSPYSMLSTLGRIRTSKAGAESDAGALDSHRERSPGTGRSGASEGGRADNPFHGRVDRLYLVLISMHGLVRGENMELGKDADTGGQVCAVCVLCVCYACAVCVLCVCCVFAECMHCAQWPPRACSANAHAGALLSAACGYRSSTWSSSRARWRTIRWCTGWSC
jgi:hypothetical protein